MLADIRQALREPISTRFLGLRWLDRRFDLFSYSTKLELGSIDRPHYGHGLLQAAILAKRLGVPELSAIEFGVAGGNGLLSLEMHAEHVTRETGVRIALYGFDTGAGMPPPQDHRDMPYLWETGYFAMDEAALRARLRHAKLFIGRVEDTVAGFCARENPAPIGFVSFDLDYYSSTAAALRIFEAPSEHLLPRVICYFDDMVGDLDWAYNRFTGELLAIDEFNAAHDDIKLGQAIGLRHFGNRLPALWHEQMFVAHLFKHPSYGRPISDLKQLPLPGPAAAR